MCPELWRKFIKPNMMARLYKKTKNKGLYVIQYSCEDIESIFPDFIDIGLDCYQTFQPGIYNKKMIKEKFGNITFWGDISAQQLLSGQNQKRDN